MNDDADDADDDDDDKARDAIDHLQVAVRELIAAGHAFLAAFEDVVEQPDTRRDLFAAFETVARRFMPEATEAEEKSDDDGEEGFEPINVE
jgi:hypothetical protein